MEILFNKKFLNYNQTSKYEGAYRLKEFPKKYKDFETGYDPTEDILRVHSERYFGKIKRACNKKVELVGLHLTPECFESALLAVAIALEASKTGNFSAARPPGHHASREKASGFCLFNNMAIAVNRLLNQGKTVAVLDLDGHHGDGTERLLKGKDSALFCSLHEQDAFPGTGNVSKGNSINFPLELPISKDAYMKALKEAIHKIRLFGPDVLGISIGFDTYKEDDLLHFELDLETYREIGFELKLNFRNAFAVLEGGYHNKILQCAEAFVAGVNSVPD